MPFFVWRRIDPDEESLLAALDEAFERALAEAAQHHQAPLRPPEDQPAPQALPVRALSEPEGAHYWQWLVGPEPYGMLIALAWWTDLMGRRHWLVEAGYGLGGTT